MSAVVRLTRVERLEIDARDLKPGLLITWRGGPAQGDWVLDDPQPDERYPDDPSRVVVRVQRESDRCVCCKRPSNTPWREVDVAPPPRVEVLLVVDDTWTGDRAALLSAVEYPTFTVHAGVRLARRSEL